MDNTQPQQTAQTTIRHYLRIMAFAVVGAIIGGSIVYVFDPRTNSQIPSSNQEVVATTSAFTRSAPVELRIPAIELRSSFEAPLGLNEDQTIEVPDSYTKVGWYKNGPTPGENGPAVILGHVDSYQGPAIFWPLKGLNAGDTIEIDREDGTTVVFKVDEVITYSQHAFPTELVYGATDTPKLRLITCTGFFDKGQQQYSHNLVVYASLVE